MAAVRFAVAGPATLQIANLPRTEQLALRRLFDGAGAQEQSRAIGGENFVAPLGTRRVLWRHGTDGRPVVLSVLDRSFAAHP